MSFLEQQYNKLTSYIQPFYTELAKNDIVKNIPGLVISLLLFFGIISMDNIFKLFQFGLYLYSLREITKYYSDKSHNTQNLLEIILLATTLYGLELFYNFGYYFGVILGLPFVSLIINAISIYFMTSLISDINKYMSANSRYVKLLLKDMDFSNASKDTYVTRVLNHVGFAIKLYTINNVVIDTLTQTIIGYVVTISCSVEKSLELVSRNSSSHFKKLYNLVLSIKKSPISELSSIELVEKTTDPKKIL